MSFEKSFEKERALDPGPRQRRGSPWMLLGFALGLLALSPGIVLYYWLFAPAAPLVLAGVFVLLATVRSRFGLLAEGALAAALFGAVCALVLFFGLAAMH